MDEASQGSVELLDSADMVGTHVDKLNPSLQAPYSIDIQRVGAPSPHQALLSNDLMDNHLVVDEFNPHNLHYYGGETDHDILSHLTDADRTIAMQLQPHQAEPQNLSAPGGADRVSAMVSAFIQTTASEVPTSQQVSGGVSERAGKAQRLPSLPPLPTLKKARGLATSSIRSRYIRSGTSDDVGSIPLLVTQDGQRIALSHLVTSDTQVAQRMLPADTQLLATVASEDQRLLSANAETHLLPDEVTLQEAVVVNQAQDHRQSTSVTQRAVTGMNGHTRVQDAQRYVAAPELVDEESVDNQHQDHHLAHLSQDQLIQVALDPQAQQFGVVSMSGQRMLVQTPGGEWAESEDAKGNFAYEDLVKHEEVEILDGSDGDVAVDELNDSDEDGEGDMRSSRRSLPHKKRLSRKLRNPRKAATTPRSIHAKCYKCTKCGEQFGTQPAYTAHKATHTTSSKKTPFSCEICGKFLPNQLKFFEHLKAHYEPRPGATGPSAIGQGVTNCVVTETESVGSETPNRSLPNRTVAKERNDSSQSEGKDDTKKKDEKKEEQVKLPQRQSTRHRQQAQQQLITSNQQHQTQETTPVQHTDQHHQQRSHIQQLVNEHGEEITLKVENVLPAEKSEPVHFQGQFQVQHPRHRHMAQVEAVQQPQQTTHRHRHQEHHHHQHGAAQSPSQRQHESGSEQGGSILPPVSTITGQISYNCNLCGKHFRKQKNFEMHMSTAHPKQEEIEEFSEPEDMMEGIRGVVEAGEDTGDEGDALDALGNLSHINQSGSQHGTQHGAQHGAQHGTQHSVESKGTWFREEELSATEADLQALQSAEQLAQMNQLCTDTPKSRMTIEDSMRHELKMELDPLDVLMDGTTGKGKNKNAKRLACPQCGRVFNYRNSLVYHLRSHSGERPHQCEECGKSFFATGALKVHMRLHSGDKPYKCEFCGRNFRQWGDLKYHCTSLHSEEKQYQCEYCGKDFARKYSLIVHRRIHTGEKNYVCEFCNKTFRASSYLQNHRRIHTGEKPHPCEVCGKPFRVRSDMKRHLNTHKRERQRLASRSDAKIGGGEVDDVPADMSADMSADGPDDSQHAHTVHTLSLPHGAHLDPDHPGVVVKTDTDALSAGMIPLARAAPTDQHHLASSLELTSQQAQSALQYGGGRDPLESARDLTTPGGQGTGTVYVWPIYMT